MVENENLDINEEEFCEDDIPIVVEEQDTEVETYKKLAAELTYQAQRVQAEFDNYRKRNSESQKRAAEDGRIEVVEKLLPVLDSFSQAFKLISDKSVLEGVSLIYDRLFAALAQLGLSKIEADGAEFDPTYHNAVMAKAVEGEESGKVLEVFQDGYMFNGKVIRAAAVIVSE